MLDWETIDQAIVDAIQAASPDGTDTDVRWKYQQNAWRDNVAVILDRSPMHAYGRDENRRSFDIATNTLTVSQVGPRAFSLTVRVESLFGAGGYGALQLLEVIRTRIFRPSVRDVLRAAGLAVTTVGPIARTDYKSSGREVSCALAEFVFLTMENDTDTSTASTWIQHVHVQSHYLTGADGNPVNPQVDKVIP